MASSADRKPDVRLYMVVFAAQLVLAGVAVLVSRFGPGGMTGVAAVMLVAALNATVVAVSLMGALRDGRFVSLLVLTTLVLIIGLLVWPAWDVSQRGRMF